jgi:hypothetical protein
MRNVVLTGLILALLATQAAASTGSGSLPWETPLQTIATSIAGRSPMTAGWREKGAGNTVLRFDPAAAEGSARFNPLDEIRLGTIHEVGDVQNLVMILVDPEGRGLVDHWAKTSHAFLTGAILQVLYNARDEGRSGTLPDVALALSVRTGRSMASIAICSTISGWQARFTPRLPRRPAT